MIGDEVLPYNMTVYQAIRQFSPLAHDQSETDTDTETPIGKFFDFESILKMFSKSKPFVFL